MTKEELKKEAEICWSWWSKAEPISLSDVHLMVVDSYINAAFQREKRIKHLEELNAKLKKELKEAKKKRLIFFRRNKC